MLRVAGSLVTSQVRAYDLLRMLGRDGHHHAHAVQVLTIADSGIAHIVSFNQPELFPVFGLPPVLPAATGTAGPRR